MFCIRAQSRSSIILNKYWQFSHFIQPIFYIKKTPCLTLIVSVDNIMIQFYMSSAETQDSWQKPSPLFSLETLSDLGISIILILQKEFGIKLYYYIIAIWRSKNFEKKNVFTLRTLDRQFGLSEWKKSNYSETKYSLDGIIVNHNQK